MDRPYSQSERAALHQLALRALEHGVRQGEAMRVDLSRLPEAFGEPRATFITLTQPGGRLRGCIGVTRAQRPLAQDIAENALAAATRDPRFEPVRPDELDGLELSISILTPPEPIEVDSEAALLAALRRGVDGLILSDPSHRASFLPSMWSQLPDPRDFVRHLKVKAGWTEGHWSAAIRAQRYTAVKIP